MLNGLAGFVVPYHKNLVYIEIEKGDRFGDIDFIMSAMQVEKTIDEIFEMLVNDKVSLIRHFTVQSICDTTLLSISVSDMNRMAKQFNDQFQELFSGCKCIIERALQQKLLATTNVDNQKLILNVHDFYRKKYGNKLMWIQKEIDLETIQVMYFEGTKTIKFIADKKRGKVK